MSTEACHNCTALYFPNISEVKESVRRRRTNRNSERKGKREQKRDSGADGGSANVLVFKPQISERLPDTEKEHRQLVPTLTWVMAPKWSSHKPAARQEQPRKQSA